MKKTKKQKRHEAKHWLNYYPNRRVHEWYKKLHIGKRFKLKHWAKTVQIMIAQADGAFGFPVRRGENGAHIWKGAHLKTGTMVFGICSGVLRKR